MSSKARTNRSLITNGKRLIQKKRDRWYIRFRDPEKKEVAETLWDLFTKKQWPQKPLGTNRKWPTWGDQSTGSLVMVQNAFEEYLAASLESKNWAAR